MRGQAGYDAEGNSLWSEGALLADTVFRFKRQTADAVFITEVDFAEFAIRERRLFVGLTRARLQVAMVTAERAAEILSAKLSSKA